MQKILDPAFQSVFPWETLMSMSMTRRSFAKRKSYQKNTRRRLTSPVSDGINWHCKQHVILETFHFEDFYHTGMTRCNLECNLCKVVYFENAELLHQSCMNTYIGNFKSNSATKFTYQKIDIYRIDCLIPFYYWGMKNSKNLLRNDFAFPCYILLSQRVLLSVRNKYLRFVFG